MIQALLPVTEPFRRNDVKYVIKMVYEDIGGSGRRKNKANFKSPNALPIEKATAEPCTSENFSPI